MDGADQLWVDNLNLHSSSVDNSCFFLFFFFPLWNASGNITEPLLCIEYLSFVIDDLSFSFLSFPRTGMWCRVQPGVTV